ncbi:MAG: hypothetical protein LEGION0398_MBIBDBAK_00476 [Legionellaceae bacterium]
MATDDLKGKKELIQILDDVLTEGVWTGSLFLEASGRKIQELRERLIKEFNLEQEVQNIPTNQSMNASTKEKEAFPIYIALYQSTGQNIKKWEMLLNSIGNFSSGRPIYKNEEDIKAFIRTKQNSQNEGYVIIYVTSKDIIKFPSGKDLFDRNGKELLLVKEGAIKPENIVQFIHETGQYKWVNGHLIKENNH